MDVKSQRQSHHPWKRKCYRGTWSGKEKRIHKGNSNKKKKKQWIHRNQSQLKRLQYNNRNSHSWHQSHCQICFRSGYSRGVPVGRRKEGNSKMRSFFGSLSDSNSRSHYHWRVSFSACLCKSKSIFNTKVQSFIIRFFKTLTMAAIVFFVSSARNSFDLTSYFF